MELPGGAHCFHLADSYLRDIHAARHVSDSQLCPCCNWRRTASHCCCLGSVSSILVFWPCAPKLRWTTLMLSKSSTGSLIPPGMACDAQHDQAPFLCILLSLAVHYKKYAIHCRMHNVYSLLYAAHIVNVCTYVRVQLLTSVCAMKLGHRKHLPALRPIWLHCAGQT